MSLFNAIDVLGKLKPDDLQLIGMVLAENQKLIKFCVVCGERFPKRSRSDKHVRTCLWQDFQGGGCRRTICVKCTESISKWSEVYEQDGITYGSYDVRCDIHSYNSTLFNILYYQLKIDAIETLE